MTIFEFVLRKYIGPPRGKSWSCPLHTDRTPSMTMQSSIASDKCRCKCYSCGFWGDVFDLLKIFHPMESFPERQLRLKDLEKELTAIHGTNASFSQGTPEARKAARVQVEAGVIWADIRDKPEFELLPSVVDRCMAVGIAVEDVVTYERSIQDWFNDSDQRHFRNCDDTDCDAEICRNARGLPPLTLDEIRRDRQEREQAMLEQRARVRHALRNVWRK